MYVYICAYVHMYICTYAHMYVCIYVRTYVCMYVCMYVFMYVCMYVCAYVCMYACMYVCTHACICRYDQGVGTVVRVTGGGGAVTVSWDSGVVQEGVRAGKGGEHWLRLLTADEAFEDG